ncbi:ethanolamine ammonia-lyase, small subunit (light chain) [Petrocella atlantisensis]|uniref:Ethanolamine ammonia-lyase small subunit n=1 Tax=Petrocella atlantisensis TaxID=2173034 RepID=A0A3P7PXL1_9FIRM|nr:ethanolamine ammonia-lyase subunit EutC [Petrocella atlantisensis]VDN48387.1 ethanolamine ammonia-lyase, small subunit (light chain) [Petrocella atlantisensis]
MVSEKELKAIIEQVLSEMKTKDFTESKKDTETVDQIDDNELSDITMVDMRKQLLVPNPENGEDYLQMKAKTSARVGVWRAGPRYKTETLLRFRADHAVAMDAVFTDVSEEIIAEMNLFTVKTKCKDKDEYLTRPDLGRKFDDEEIALVKEKCKMNPQVQVIVADGLSSTAIEANIRDILPVLFQGLEGYGIKVGTPFFIKYGRVPSMDVISEVTGADITCLFVGERPGLATGESMSAYIAYKGTVGMPEARRTVVSNIHQGGTAAVEAGAHIAHILKEMLDQKKSGLELQL